MKAKFLATPQTAFILTDIILVLASIASAGGLFWPGLYRDKALIKAAWLGNDLVTLVVVVPLLALALRQAQRGSERAYLIWLGLMIYAFYNYAFYLFGAAFNKFFLLYAALFSLSLFALVLGLLGLDIRLIQQLFRPQIPVKWISIFLLFISLALGIVETSQCVNFIINGKTPEIPPLIIALDLSIVVPNTALAAVLLWRRHPWGLVLAIMMLVKAFAYGLVLSLSSILIAGINKLGPWDPFLLFYLLVTVGGLNGSLILLVKIKTQTAYNKEP